MRKEVALAALGFLIGAAAIVGGQDDGDLREQLRRLQAAADRVMQQGWEVRNLPPANARGQELRLFPVYDLTCGVPDFMGLYERYGFTPLSDPDSLIERLMEH